MYGKARRCQSVSAPHPNAGHITPHPIRPLGPSTLVSINHFESLIRCWLWEFQGHGLPQNR